MRLGIIKKKNVMDKDNHDNETLKLLKWKWIKI